MPAEKGDQSLGLNTSKMQTLSDGTVTIYGNPEPDHLACSLHLAPTWCKTLPNFCILVDWFYRVLESASMFTSGQGNLYDGNLSASFERNEDQHPTAA